MPCEYVELIDSPCCLAMREFGCRPLGGWIAAPVNRCTMHDFLWHSVTVDSFVVTLGFKEGRQYLR